LKTKLPESALKILAIGIGLILLAYFLQYAAFRNGTASPTGISSSNSSSTSPLGTSTAGTIGAFNGDWANLRGVAYPWQALLLHPDQSGAPAPEWSFAQFRNLGWNLIRLDMGSWGMYLQNKSGFLSTFARIFNAADANGIYVVFCFTPAYDEMPVDIQAAVPSASWASFWWADSPYPGTNSSLQGLGIWEASFKGYIGPMLREFGSRQSLLMLKFVNEPGELPTDALGTLARYYGIMGGLARAAGFQGYLSYEGPGGNEGYAGLINSILKFAPNFKPAVYDIHYPDQSGIASEASTASASGVALWVGEVHASWVNSASLGTLRQHNVALTVYRWDEDGNLLVKWTGGLQTAPATGTLTRTATGLSNLETQVLGTPEFFA
jgi:hypothetical protein